MRCCSVCFSSCAIASSELVAPQRLPRRAASAWPASAAPLLPRGRRNARACAPVLMSGRSRTSATSSDQQLDAGLAQRGEADTAAPAPAPAPGCCSSNAIALRTRLRFGAGAPPRPHARALRRHVRLRRAGARADAGEFGQALLHQVAERAVGNLRQQRLGAFGQARLAVERAEVDVLATARRRRTPTAASPARRRASKPSAPSLRTMRVGILAVGQEQEERLAAVLHARQHRLQRLPRRAAAGAIAVEAEEHVGRVAEQQFGVVGRGRGAERGHRLGHAVLEQRDHVHVALDHDQPRDLAVAPAAPATGRTARGPCGTARSRAS